MTCPYNSQCRGENQSRFEHGLVGNSKDSFYCKEVHIEAVTDPIFLIIKVMLNFLKFGSPFSFCAQLKYWLSGLELAKYLSE